jgi:peptidoglycan/xylan/chitin deacetylase (PgdA/CDA1 family)
LIPIVALAAAISLAPPPARRVAVTFDDLPGATASIVGDGVPALEAMTRRLLAAVREAHAPAIGFVNEGKLAPDGRREETRVALLTLWLDAGLELGNHTYSHSDLHRTPLADFENDVRRGEEVTRALLKDRGKSLRYFRHPFLHTGQDLPTKLGLEAFLKARGCRVAPVTHDNSEWIFARAYALTAQRGDSATGSRIAEAYVPYMDAKFDYFERQSQALFGREIPQVLLLHANSLNADKFGALAAMMKKRGYALVTLDRALEDPAYVSPDTYTGPAGITWLHRWALTRGGKDLVLPDEPRTPDWVLREAGVDSE